MAKADITAMVKEKIAIAEANGNIAIDVNKLAERIGLTVRLDDVSIDELRESFIKTKIIGIMNFYDYFSVEYGCGVYVNFDKAPAEIKAVIASSQGNANSKSIQKHKDRVTKSFDSDQFVIGFDENGVITCVLPKNKSASLEALIDELKIKAI